MNPQEAPQSYFELMRYGTLLNQVEAALKRLPDPALRSDAIERLKRDIVGMANQIVEELSRPKPAPGSPVPPEEPFQKFVIELGGITIHRELYLFEETLEDYLAILESELRDFMKQARCPICADPLSPDQIHPDCAKLDRLRHSVKLLSLLEKAGRLSADDQLKLMGYQQALGAKEWYLQQRKNRDGRPWNASIAKKSPERRPKIHGDFSAYLKHRNNN